MNLFIQLIQSVVFVFTLYLLIENKGAKREKFLFYFVLLLMIFLIARN